VEVTVHGWFWYYVLYEIYKTCKTDV
jgi:hypothetical protein